MLPAHLDASSEGWRGLPPRLCPRIDHGHETPNPFAATGLSSWLATYLQPQPLAASHSPPDPSACAGRRFLVIKKEIPNEIYLRAQICFQTCSAVFTGRRLILGEIACFSHLIIYVSDRLIRSHVPRSGRIRMVEARSITETLPRFICLHVWRRLC